MSEHRVIRLLTLVAVALGIVAGARMVNNAQLAAENSSDLFDDLIHRALVRAARVHGQIGIGAFVFHQPGHRIDQIVHVAEAPRLRTVAVDRQRLGAKGLHDEV